ncbi:hypothetical protein GJ744_004209 [Endocarpon pusillum]|uniref:Uncharacterized protein n=1 Tax=Endocarpon pusillum TaxID=364733 RepID=A0A8H7A9U5_9EURO|nr:hypothetical protein GJ744_004209 [Endocarpon pusillum]
MGPSHKAASVRVRPPPVVSFTLCFTFQAVRFVYRQSFCSANFGASPLIIYLMSAVCQKRTRSPKRAMKEQLEDWHCTGGTAPQVWRTPVPAIGSLWHSLAVLFTCISIEAIYVGQYGVYKNMESTQ